MDGGFSHDPPTITPGQNLSWKNLDANPDTNAFHTITSCKAPCNKTTGIAYPVANGPVSFDSGQLGFNGQQNSLPGAPALDKDTGGININTDDLQPGTYTYFCRIHPFMRGSFRVASSVICHGQKATLVGTDGADVIKGTKKRDVIVGLGGNDKIIGLGGNDVICGGAGKDKEIGGAGRDTLYGDGGKDKVMGGLGKDMLVGGGGKDRLLGGAGNDKMNGGAGKDRLLGGPGKDRFLGKHSKDLAKQ